MTQTEPDIWALEHITITKDPRTDLVVVQPSASLRR